MRHVILIIISFLYFFSTQGIFAQETCASSSQNAYEWPGHNNMFFGNGNVYNQTTGTASNIAGITSYEGISAASDDQGNLLFVTNGRNLWDETGTLKYTGLLQGNEGGSTGANGSASQGVITVRHPMTPNEYYVFTTDDVLSPTTYGFNYASFDQNGDVVKTTTRLGTLNTTEGISATKHANGVDIWITVHRYNSPQFHSYLLTCTGIDLVNSPVISSVGPSASGQTARGGISFSWDGSHFASAYPFGWPDNNKQMSVYQFDNATGIISDPRHIAPVLVLAPYDVMFSPDNNSVYYFNRSNGNIGSYNITSWVTATMTASHNGSMVAPAATGTGSFGSMDLGADGNIYIASQAGGFRRATGATTGSLATANLGLSTLFIPPAEEPDITEVGPFCSTDAAVDLATTWICAGIDAEDPTNYPNAYSGTGITNTGTGIFNPATANIGNNQIIFQRCSVNDTINIVVNTCSTPCVPPTGLAVTPQPSDLCVGDDETYNVTFSGTPNDDYYITWFNNSTASVKGPTTDGTANANNYDLTNAQTGNAGTWTVRIEDGNNDDAACYTEETFDITVTAIPIASIAISPNDSICEGETVNLIASGGSGTATYDWADVTGTDNPTTRNGLSPTATTNYTVTADNGSGCNDDTTITITVIPNPIASITFAPNDTVCAGTSVDVTPSGGATFVWEDLSNNDPRTINTTGDYTLTANNFFCTDDTTFHIEVIPMPIASIAISPNDSICEGETVNLIASGGSGTATYNWTDEAGTDNPTTRNGLSPTATTNYTVTTDNGSGCTDDTTITITVIPNPIASITFAPNDTVCAGTSVDVTPSGGATFVWEDLSNNDPRTINTTGDYTLTANNFFCTDDTTFHIEVIPIPIASIAISPNDSICEGETVNLIASGGSGTATYDWADITGTDNPTTRNGLSPTATTNYTVTADNGSGCTDDTTITITVITNPIASITFAPNDTVCAGTSVDVTPSGGATFVWEDLSNNDPRTINTTGDYTLTANNFFCTDDTTFHIEVIPMPIASIAISPNDSICEGETVNLIASGGSGTATYDWADITGTDNPTTRNGLSPAATTNYTVTADNGSGCTDDTTITITVIPNPIASITFAPNDTVCAGTSVDVTPSGGATFVWEDLSNNDPRTINTTGDYTLTANNFFCTDDTTFHIEVHPIPTVTPQVSPITICKGTATGIIALNATPAGATFIWTSTGTNITNQVSDELVGANAIPDHTPNYTGTGVQGTITYAVTATLNGCPSTPENFVVNIDKQPIATVGVDQQICADNTTLTATDPSPFVGTWTKVDRNGSGVGPGAINSVNVFNSTISGLANGDSTYLNWTVSNGVCNDSIDQLVIKVASDEVPTVTISANPTSICTGSPIDLTATGTGTGTTPTYEFFNGTASIRAALANANSYNGSTDFTNTGNTPITVDAIVEMISNTTCLAAGASNIVRDTIEIIIDPNPSASIPGADQTICAENTNMAATLPTSGNGAWVYVSGPGNIANTDQNSITAAVTGLTAATPTVYAWVISSENNLCPTDSAAVTITTTGNLTAPDAQAQSTTLCATDAYPTLLGTPLNASASPSESSSWTSLNGPTITPTGTIDATIAASSMTGGNTYQFVHTTTNGLCPVKTDTVTISINTPPTVSLSPTTANSCGLTPYGLNAIATNEDFISWASNGGGVFSPTDNDTTDFTPPAQNGTTYTLTITAHGIGTCADATASLDLTVNAGPTVNAGSDAALCEGNNLNLNSRATIASASGQSGLTWSSNTPGGSFDDATLINPTYTPPTNITSGNIILTLTATGNAPCNFVDDDFTFTINPNPTIPNFQHSTTAICASSSNVPASLSTGGITDESLYNFTWYKQTSSSNQVVAGPLNGFASTNLTGLTNGDLIFLEADLISSTCPSTPVQSNAVAVVIDAVPDIQIDASNPSIVCTNDNYTITFTDNTIDPSYTPTYAWRDINGNPLSGSTTTLNDSKTTAGNFTYKLLTTNGLCSSEKAVLVTIKQPYVEATADPTVIDLGQATTVTANDPTSTEAYAYVWSTNNISSSNGLVTQSITDSPLETTTYTVTSNLTNVDDPSSTNCSASASTTVVVTLPPLPDQVFSPGNGDGKNDYWRILYLNKESYPNNVVRVFNRWGNVVYEGIGYDYDGEVDPEEASEKWDGTNGGGLVPVATYYYVIELNNDDNTVLSGAITIIR